MSYGSGDVNMEGALLLHYRVGDTIEYATFGGRRRLVLVEFKTADIKNGEPGFDGTLLEDGAEPFGVWGYDRQIIRVVNRKKETS